MAVELQVPPRALVAALQSALHSRIVSLITIAYSLLTVTFFPLRTQFASPSCKDADGVDHIEFLKGQSATGNEARKLTLAEEKRMGDASILLSPKIYDSLFSRLSPLGSRFVAARAPTCSSAPSRSAETRRAFVTSTLTQTA